MIHCHHGVWNGSAHQMGSNMCLGSELQAVGAPLGWARGGEMVAWSHAPHPDVDKPSSLCSSVCTTVPFFL